MARILHLMHDFYDNSMTRITGQIIENVRPHGFSFHCGAVASNDNDVSESLRQLGAETIEFFRHESIPTAVREYVRAHNIDVIHSHSPRTAIIAALALRRLAGVKHVHTRHLLTQPTSRRFGIVYTAVDRISLYVPDLIMPVSRTMGADIKAVPFVDHSKIEPIQNGVDVRRFYVPEEREAARTELGLHPEDMAIIFTGRLTEMKRLDLLISSFAEVHARLPRARLIIVGVGDLEAGLKAQAQTLGVADAILWTGFRRDIPRLLAAADVYVQASSNEGLSLSILEAMAAGKAIVSTDVGAAREVLEHDVTALVIPPNNQQALTEALMQVLSTPNKAHTLATNARQVVNAQFSVERMAAHYEDVYRRFSNGRH